MKTLLLFALGFLAFVSASFAQAPLRNGDSLEISLKGVPTDEIQQFTALYTVDDSGSINLPYIGYQKAAGLLPNQLQAQIEQKLKEGEIYTHPSITVQVQQGQRFVSVGGAVRAPGRIVYTSDLTLMSAINASGSFNDFADPKKVRLVHEGKATVYDTRKFRKDPSLDPKVFPGDQIEVPQSWF
jgi:polysaccharide export outer membrane protein